MKIKDMCSNGVYAFKDNSIDKIVYVGSTFTSLAERLGKHIGDVRTSRHCNDKLSNLINSGDFDFIPLETGFNDKMKLLDRERYYTLKYNTHKDGYNLNVGGCRLLKIKKNYTKNKFEETNNVLKIRNFIAGKYINKRLREHEKLEIIEFIKKNGFPYMDTGVFAANVKRLGFNINRYSNKREYIITQMEINGSNVRETLI